MEQNIVWHNHGVDQMDRNALLGFRNKVLWFTGLSGSGKSTVANRVAKRLHDQGVLTYVLDGDNVRHGLNSDLGFSSSDRQENIRRIAEVAKLFYDAGVFVIVCFISPFRKDRDYARSLIGSDFVEVFVDCPLDVCEGRDPKGLYKKARVGEISDFTGISAPYEKPLKPDVVVDTSLSSLEESVKTVLNVCR